MRFQPVVCNLSDAAATRELGCHLGCHLPAGTVILLTGAVGSGKTTLTQGLGAGLGLTEPVDSPTFTLISEYLQGRLPLYHVDLYRLSGSEVDTLYLETYWEGIEVPPGITVIEWAERLNFLPPHPLTLRLALHGSGRQVTMEPTTPNQVQTIEACPCATG